MEVIPVTQKEKLIVIAEFYRLHPIEIIRQLIDLRFRHVETLQYQLRDLRACTDHEN